MVSVLLIFTSKTPFKYAITCWIMGDVFVPREIKVVLWRLSSLKIKWNRGQFVAGEKMDGILVRLKSIMAIIDHLGKALLKQFAPHESNLWCMDYFGSVNFLWIGVSFDYQIFYGAKVSHWKLCFQHCGPQWSMIWFKYIKCLPTLLRRTTWPNVAFKLHRWHIYQSTYVFSPRSLKILDGQATFCHY